MSFIRKGAHFDVRQQQNVPASCKISLSGNLVASTGISTFDSLLGEGIPLGSLIMILEDEPRSSSNYANTILKCFLSQGLVAGNEVLFAGEDAEKVRSGLPGTSSRSDQQVVPPAEPAVKAEKMSIAWRYKHIKAVESAIESTPKNTAYGNAFDLAKKIDPELGKKMTIIVDPFGNGLEEIREALKRAHQDKSLVRIALRSLGSPLNDNLNLFYWVYKLKRMIRNKPATVMMTCPSYLIDPKLVNQLGHLSDFVMEIQSFAGTPKSSDSTFRDYQGFIHIIKHLRQPDSLALILPETGSLAFKCKQRRFIIEKYHLPPDLGEVPQSDSTSGCGTGSNNIDF